MATVVTHYLDPAAEVNIATGASVGDGTTTALTGVHAAFARFADWNTQCGRNLVTADEIEELICNTAGSDVTVARWTAASGGWTTDSTRYISIKTGPSDRATAKWDSAKFTVEDEWPIDINAPLDVRVDGLQLAVKKATAGGSVVGLVAQAITASHHVVVSNCFIRSFITSTLTRAIGIWAEQGAPGSATETLQVINTIIVGFSHTTGSGGGDGIHDKGTTVSAYNCTIYDCYYGLNEESFTLNAYNCGIAGCTTPIAGGVGQTNCSTDTPTFIDAANFDFHLSPDDVIWKDQGADPSAGYTTDIEGQTRSGLWDIGADEVGQPTQLARTMAEALRNPFATIHWLLEMDIGGSTRRYADAGLSIGSRLYAGALQMSTSPSITIDPYTALASAATCSISLIPLTWDDPSNPLLRPCDLEDATGNPIIGTPVRVYRWAEETPESERELIIDGHVTAATADGDGTITLEISDFSVWYSRVALPWYIMTEDTWPDGEYDDRGLRAPICFGTFSNVQVVSSDAANDYEIISHHIDSVTAGKVGSTSDTPVLTNTTDSDGEPVARLNYSVNTDNEVVTCSGVGYIDTAAGEYTGTGAAVLTHVAEQLRCLAEQVVGIPAAKVDKDSFLAVKSKTSLWQSAIVLEDSESTSSERDIKDSSASSHLFSVAEEAMLPYVGACYVERGLLRLRLVDTAKPARYHIREHGALLNYEDIAWSDWGEDIPAGIEIKFDYGYSLKYDTYRTRQVRLVKAVDYPPFAKAAAAGASMKQIEAKHLRDADTVEFMVARMKEWYSKTRRSWTVTADRETHPVELLDVVAVTASKAPNADGTGFAGKRGIVVGIEYGLGENVLTLMEC